MRIVLLRHGIAVDRGEWPADLEFDRPLTDEGKKKLRRVLKSYRSRGGKHAVVYSSPLIRARETAEVAVRVLEARLELIEQLEPGGNAFSWLKTCPEPEPLLVGHEPDLAHLAARCMGLRRTFFEHKKAGLSCLEGEPGQMRLLWLLTPRVTG